MKRILNNIANGLLIAGVIILLISAYYLVIKAGIPYQDPLPELQIKYAVNAGIGEELFKNGSIVFVIGLAGRIITSLLCKKLERSDQWTNYGRTKSNNRK